MNLIEGPIMVIHHSFWKDLWVANFSRDERSMITMVVIYAGAVLAALAVWQFTNYAVSKGATRMKINANYIWTLLTIIVVALVASVAGAQTAPAPSERVDIYSRDGEHLGCVGGFASSCSQFNPDSIENEFGAGSQFKPDGLRNQFGDNGSQFSNESWSNPYATKPPVVIETEPGYRWAPRPYGYDSPYKGDLTENDYNYNSLKRWDPALDYQTKSILDPDDD